MIHRADREERPQSALGVTPVGASAALAEVVLTVLVLPVAGAGALTAVLVLFGLPGLRSGRTQAA